MNMIISYLTLRKIIGWIGCLIPLVIVLGSYTNGFSPLLLSVSDYYHINSGDLLVGMLTVCGLFLISYKGHDFKDNLIANFAGVFIIMVAFFPNLGEGREYLFQFLSPRVVNVIHFTSAVITFIFLGIMSYCQFSKTNNHKMKKAHKVLGLVIWGALLLAGIVIIIPNNNFLINSLKILFWLEAVMLEAFGVSWLLKAKFLSALHKK